MNLDLSSFHLIAYYLPQYYEMDFNNRWYGKGYTEWTITSKAKPLFKGHYQPHLPADLGFYNLLMPEARAAQADMARKYGIDGFCYWHYWFGDGKTLMEKPFDAVLQSKEPDFPFCLSWANHGWVNPSTGQSIMKMGKLTEEDHIRHFQYLLPAFKDSRYICIDGRPLFSIFEPNSLSDINGFINLWNGLATQNGLEGFYFVGIAQTPEEYAIMAMSGLDAINTVRLKDFLKYRNPFVEFLKYKLNDTHNYDYSEASKYFVSSEDIEESTIPTIISGWDHSPRSGRNALVLTDYTPQSFEQHLRQVFDLLSKKKNKLCFVKSWNEWGEGNYLEPDLKYGLSFLEVLDKVKNEYR